MDINNDEEGAERRMTVVAENLYRCLSWSSRSNFSCGGVYFSISVHTGTVFITSESILNGCWARFVAVSWLLSTL